MSCSLRKIRYSLVHLSVNGIPLHHKKTAFSLYMGKDTGLLSHAEQKFIVYNGKAAILCFIVI